VTAVFFDTPSTNRQSTTSNDLDVAVWHFSDMPAALRDVRSQGQSGKHMLASSFSGFDPTRTLACILRVAVVRPVSALSHRVRLRARQSISLRLRICDGFRVVVREESRTEMISNPSS
jgi:hypothetical protein